MAKAPSGLALDSIGLRFLGVFADVESSYLKQVSFVFI